MAAVGEAEPFAEPWSAAAPVDTPRGLAAPELAARVFPLAVEETLRRFGSRNATWGEVHRVRRGSVDEPVGGCAALLGCFRVLNFVTKTTVAAVPPAGRLGPRCRVHRSPTPSPSWPTARVQRSPHADQASLFARGEMKPVAYTREDVERLGVRRYRLAACRTNTKSKI